MINLIPTCMDFGKCFSNIRLFAVGVFNQTKKAIFGGVLIFQIYHQKGISFTIAPGQKMQDQCNHLNAILGSFIVVKK